MRVWTRTDGTQVFNCVRCGAKGSLNAPLLSAQERSFELSGGGVGLQFSMPGHFFARADVATPFSDRPADNGRDPQYYVRFGARF